MYDWNLYKNETFKSQLLKMSKYFKVSYYSAPNMHTMSKVQYAIFSHNLFCLVPHLKIQNH